MRDPRRLKAYQLADELVMTVYQKTNSFPKDEIFGLRSQVKRAAVSIPSNIVEGCSRINKNDYTSVKSTIKCRKDEKDFKMILMKNIAVRYNIGQEILNKKRSKGTRREAVAFFHKHSGPERIRVAPAALHPFQTSLLHEISAIFTGILRLT